MLILVKLLSDVAKVESLFPKTSAKMQDLQVEVWFADEKQVSEARKWVYLAPNPEWERFLLKMAYWMNSCQTFWETNLPSRK